MLVIAGQIITALLRTKMPEPHNRIHDQSRVNAVVIDNENAAAAIDGGGPVMQVSLQVHNRQQVTPHVSDAAYPGLGPRNLGQTGRRKDFGDLGQGGNQLQASQAESDADPVLVSLLLLWQTVSVIKA